MNILRKLIHILMNFIPDSLRKYMLSCEDAALYVCNQDQLSGLFKYKVKMHIFLCVCCSNLNNQLRFIDKNCKELNKIKLTDEQLDKLQKSKASTIKKYLK